jgi:hypothetical protein
MSSNYTGLYVQRLENGTIYSVQVVDTAGNTLPLNPSTYIERAIQPAIELLPSHESLNP